MRRIPSALFALPFSATLALLGADLALAQSPGPVSNPGKSGVAITGGPCGSGTVVGTLSSAGAVSCAGGSLFATGQPRTGFTYIPYGYTSYATSTGTTFDKCAVIWADAGTISNLGAVITTAGTGLFGVAIYELDNLTASAARAGVLDVGVQGISATATGNILNTGTLTGTILKTGWHLGCVNASTSDTVFKSSQGGILTAQVLGSSANILGFAGIQQASYQYSNGWPADFTGLAGFSETTAAAGDPIILMVYSAVTP